MLLWARWANPWQGVAYGLHAQYVGGRWTLVAGYRAVTKHPITPTDHIAFDAFVQARAHDADTARAAQARASLESRKAY